MVDPTTALDLLGASTPSPLKPPKTVGEFFDDTDVSLGPSKARWYVEAGNVYMERIYNNDNEWEERINLFHESQPIRNFRFEIVKENGDSK